jgi:hypothetical protein
MYLVIYNYIVAVLVIMLINVLPFLVSLSASNVKEKFLIPLERIIRWDVPDVIPSIQYLLNQKNNPQKRYIKILKCYKEKNNWIFKRINNKEK